MRLVIGLGNPGARYVGTRHNVGFRVVDAFAERLRIESDAERFEGRYREGLLERDGAVHRVGLLQPMTFMNRSGESVERACAELGEAGSFEVRLAPEDCMVVYDDLDLDFGRIRLRAAGGPGGHNGIASVTRELDTRAVPRLRFGISRPSADCDPIEYVLGAFGPDQESRMSEALIRACEALECWILQGIGEAMSRHNSDPSRPVPDAPRASAEADG